jgi:hypothetical protein
LFILGVFLIELLGDLKPSLLNFNSHNVNLAVLQVLKDLLSSKIIDLLLEIFGVLVLEDLSDFLVVWL